MKTNFEKDLSKLVEDILVSFRSYYEKQMRKHAGKRESNGEISEETGCHISERYEALRKWRRDVSRSLSLPAFILFSNRTLQEIARANPHSLEELRSIYGVGPRRSEQFGSFILEVLKKCSGKPGEQRAQNTKPSPANRQNG